MYPDDLRYTKDHEWVRLEGDRGTVGITHYAQKQLGDVVYLELPEVGRALSVQDTFGTVESVKAVSDLYAPVSGKVVEVNAPLGDSPEYVNQDCYGEGWMIVIELSDAKELDELMTVEQYGTYLKEHG